MKTLLPITLLIAVVAQNLLAQTTTLTFQSLGAGSEPVRQHNISVLAGEVFELLTWAPSNSISGSGLSVEGIGLPLRANSYGESGIAYNPQKIIVAGPTTITVEVVNNQRLACTYRLTQVSTVATQNVASQAVYPRKRARARGRDS